MVGVWRSATGAVSPVFTSVLHRVTFVGATELGLFAFFQPVTLSVHLQNMDMVGQAI